MRPCTIFVLTCVVACLPSEDSEGGGTVVTTTAEESDTTAAPLPTGDGPPIETTTGGPETGETGEPETSGTGGAYVPSCGNGVLDPGEECDEPHTCTQDNCRRPMLVFTTGSQVFSPQELGGGVGGLAGADAACQAMADAADYPGRYKAWLSTSLSSPRRRFAEQPGASYQLLHQSRTVAWSYDALFAGDDEVNGNFGIDEDAFGNVNDDPNAQVWTATGPDGRVVGSGTCADWTGPIGLVVRGKMASKLAPDWTALDWPTPEVSCREQRLPIYCFRQGEDCERKVKTAGRAACEDAGLDPSCFEFTIEESGPIAACLGMETMCSDGNLLCPVSRELCAEVFAECA